MAGPRDRRPDDLPLMVRLNLSKEETKQLQDIMEKERRGSSNAVTVLIAEALQAQKARK